MTDRDEKLELAWLVTSTEWLLKGIAVRQAGLEPVPDDCPALTPQQCHMVMVVHERAGMTLRQLTEALLVSAPAASTMLDRLVEMGVLTREENPEDRREVLVRVSESSCARFDELRRRYVHTVADIFEKIGIEYARMWGAVCRRIREVLAEERKP